MKVPSLAKGELLHKPEACRRLRPQAPQREIAVKGDLSTIPFPAPTGSCCDGQEEATARPAFAPACVHRGGDIQTTVPPSPSRPGPRSQGNGRERIRTQGLREGERDVPVPSMEVLSDALAFKSGIDVNFQTCVLKCE